MSSIQIICFIPANIHGKPLPITDRTAGFIWIDALCINQADLKECAEQVKGMRDIYKTAKVVRVWLGTTLVTEEGSPRVFPDMKTRKLAAALGHIRLAELGHMPVILSFLAQALRNEPRSGEDNGYESVPGATAETEQDKVGLVGFPLPHAPEWAILAGFLEQPWFNRVWVVQEVVVAQEAKVMMGDWEMQWEPFARATEILDEAGMSCSYSTTTEVWKGLSLLGARYVHHIRQLPGRTRLLLDLLNDSRRRKATKPADHVFAVLAMAREIVNPDPQHPGLLTLVTIDYNKPTAQVFRDATWFVLLNHFTLIPLYLVELSDDQSIQHCPSWVPLWTVPQKTIDLHDVLFNTDLGKEVNIDSHDDNTLRVSGYAFECVQALNPGLKTTSQTPVTMDSNFRWQFPPHNEEIEFVTSAWDLAKSFQVTASGETRLWQRPYQSPNAVLEAFAYTLTGNWIKGNERADSSGVVINSAKAWLQDCVDRFSQSTSFLGKIWHAFQKVISPFSPKAYFQACLLRACISRRFFMTSSGFMGIGPESMKEGDIVAVIFGLSLPFLLRRSQADASNFLVVGPCYVHGIMDGELVRALEGQPPQVFNLV